MCQTKQKPAKRTQGMNWITKKKRLAIYMRDGMACVWCGNTLEDGSILSLDHVVPYSKGGTNHESNLVCSCKKCNSSRGDRSMPEFARATAGYINHDVDANDIIKDIRNRTRRTLKPYLVEAANLLDRRPTWQSALESAQ